MAKAKKNPAPIEQATTSPEQEDKIVYTFTLKNSGLMQLEVNKDYEIPIGQVPGAALMFAYLNGKKIMDTLFEEKKLSDEKKEEERYNMLTYHFLTTKKMGLEMLENVFGKFDEAKLMQMVAEAEVKYDEHVTMMQKQAQEVAQKQIAEGEAKIENEVDLNDKNNPVQL